MERSKPVEPVLDWIDDQREAHTHYLQLLVDQIPAFLRVIDRDRLIGLHMEEVTRMGASAQDLELSLDMHRRALRGVPRQRRPTSSAFGKLRPPLAVVGCADRWSERAEQSTAQG